jgi:hypothetical protein
MAIWRPNLKNPQKGGPIPKNPMKQVISGAVTNRKGAVKMTVKTGVKTERKNHPKRSRKSTQNGVENPTIECAMQASTG